MEQLNINGWSIKQCDVQHAIANLYSNLDHSTEFDTFFLR